MNGRRGFWGGAEGLRHGVCNTKKCNQPIKFMETATLTPTKHTNLRHLLEEQTRDLYNAETKYAEFLNRMKLASNDGDLEAKFAHVREATATNLEKLKTICNELNVPPTGVKCEAMAGLLKEAEGH